MYEKMAAPAGVSFAISGVEPTLVALTVPVKPHSALGYV
jgi:hypothetical protein